MSKLCCIAAKDCIGVVISFSSSSSFLLLLHLLFLLLIVLLPLLVHRTETIALAHKYNSAAFMLKTAL